MEGNFTIEVRVSRDTGGRPRFTTEEVEKLIVDGDIRFQKNILYRISDGKVVGEIKKVNLT